jgi:hypothetical protein
LSDARNICLKTAIKFGGGGPAAGWFVVKGCSLLIFHLNFLDIRCVKRSKSGHATKDSLGKNKLVTPGVHQSDRSCGGLGSRKWTGFSNLIKKGAGIMATYRDPVRCFAPLEIIERLLEIRVEAGYSPSVYLLSPDDLADYLDAYGFDVYALSEADAEFHFGDYRASLAPGGDHAHCSLTAH